MSKTELLGLLEAFSGLHVLTIGEAMLDSYLRGSTHRQCQEAPVPIVAVSKRDDTPGGAANTAANINALGASVTLVSATGEDHEGELLRQALEERGVSTQHVLAEPSRRTLAKHRLLAGSELLLRFDHGSVEPISHQTEKALVDRLSSSFRECDAVLVSDYGYGILTPRVIQTLRELDAASQRVLVVDSKRSLPAYRHMDVTAATPNYAEALHLLGWPAVDRTGRVHQIESAGERLLELTGARNVAVTLDADGAVLFERGNGRCYRTYAGRADNLGAAGAGDTFAAGLALSLAAGGSVAAAAELASAAAAIVVTKEGTSSCRLQELRGYLAAQDELAQDQEAGWRQAPGIRPRTSFA